MFGIHQLIQCVEEDIHIQPEGRRAAIVSSLRQVAALTGLEVSAGALLVAFGELAKGHPSDDAPTTARRKTCGEIHRAGTSRLSVMDALPPEDAAPWFEAQIAAWYGSEDPRLRAMANTAARELGELRGR